MYIVIQNWSGCLFGVIYKMAELGRHQEDVVGSQIGFNKLLLFIAMKLAVWTD